MQEGKCVLTCMKSLSESGLQNCGSHPAQHHIMFSLWGKEIHEEWYSKVKHSAGAEGWILSSPKSLSPCCHSCRLSLWHLQLLSLSKRCSNNYARYANYPLIKGMIAVPLCQLWFLQKGLKRCSHRNKWIFSTLSFTRTKSSSCFSQTERKKSHRCLARILGQRAAGEPQSSTAGNHHSSSSCWGYVGE